MGLFKKKDPIVEVEKALDHEVHEMEHGQPCGRHRSGGHSGGCGRGHEKI